MQKPLKVVGEITVQSIFTRAPVALVKIDCTVGGKETCNKQITCTENLQ